MSLKALTYPLDKDLRGSEWETIARACLPDYPDLDLDRLSQDFLTYLHFVRGVHLHSSKVQARFEFYCQNVASRNWD